ncbi:MAG: hypothetical protein KDB10_11540 [Acidimicrobiales bacterium]|nr:hypothetical protein [Acidimicrobiales bacterium]
MDVRLDAEQKALRDAAAQIVRDLAPKAVGDLDDAGRTAKLDAAVAAAGWRELRAPADEPATPGAAPLASAVEVGIVAEALGYGVADTAFIGPTLAAELRRLAGAPAADGPETVGLTPDLSALAEAGDALVAVDAAGATQALVCSPAAGGHALATVALPGGAQGNAAVDLTRPSIALAAGAAATPVEGAAPLDDDTLTRWTALALAVTAADLVGTMAGATELARAYAVERHQYGVAVGSFQAVQHLLADAFTLTEGARSAALHAAWAVDALDPAEALAAGAVAKAYAARHARTAGETAIQVHGGIGNTWECLAHVHLRRALVSTEVAGGEGANLDRVLTHLGIDA